MGQVEFLRALFETGRVRVDPPGDRFPAISEPAGGPPRGESVVADDDPAGFFPDDGPTALDVLAEWDAANRLEFPGEAPPFLPATAIVAARAFHRACQYTVYRDVDTRTVAALFAQPIVADAEGPITADHHYAVDLVFRFLPELFRLAHRASQGDPLCDGLRLWAAEWPLSSIGMAEVNPGDLSAVRNHAGLVRLYADRVIARRDVARLADPGIRAAVLAALGIFGDLCSPVAKALRSFEPPALAAAVNDGATGDGAAPPPAATGGSVSH